MYSSLQRRLALKNVFIREMKSECIQSHEFQRRLHFREDWLWRTLSIGKWRVNVFIISEKIGTVECFRSGNEEWMYSNILRGLLNDDEFQDKKIQVDPESQRPVEWRVQRWLRVSEKTSFQIRTFSFGKWRVNVFKATTPSKSSKMTTSFREDFISEKIGNFREYFRSGNEEWMYSKPTTPSKSSKTTTSFRPDFISEKIGYSRERFRSQGKWRVNVFKDYHAFQEFEADR